MEEIGKILPVAFRRRVRAADPRLVELLRPVWCRVVGQDVAEHSRPTGLEGGTLRLATECSTWATQLQRMADDILGAVNAFLGGRVVRNIRVEYAPHLDFSRLPRESPKPARGPEANELSGATRLAGLDPETARILEQSFAKYFARARGWNRWP